MLVLLLLAALLVPAHAAAQLRAEPVVTGLSSPVAFVPDPAFDDVFYIVEQAGLVKVLIGGQLQTEPFVDLRGAISSGGERGLLGMAFAPDVWSGRVFVNFTNEQGHTVVARFERTAAAPFRAVPSSRFDLRWPTGERVIRQPFSNHNGGHLAFGPDGYLYIGLGDGGSGNDPDNLAQDPSSLLGKMLRIDVNVPADDPSGYRVPPDNPFLDGVPVHALGEIWAFGLRNPWRYAFDDVGAGATNALIIGDVGQGAREEINVEPPGAGGRNYGWRLREGSIATPGVPPTAAAFGPLIDPLFDYDRSVGRSVTAGFVYRGQALPAAYRGRYFVADFVTSRVGSLGLAIHPATGQPVVVDVVEHTAELGGNLGGIASFGRDRHGELYLVTFAGRVLKISAATPVPNAPTNLTASVNGTTVVLSWTPPAGGPEPTSYRIEAGFAPGTTDVGVLAVPAHQTTVTVENVPAGEYFVRIRAVNAAGAGQVSGEVLVAVF